jgi:hypothetical protein
LVSYVNRMTLSRSLSSALIVIVVAIIAGCGGDNEGREVTGGAHQPEREPVAARPAKATTESRCDIGGRPDYFVPGGDDGPSAIIGCARLGASGKPVEFSADYERIGRNDHVCISPAYRGRGQLGIYIPTACVRDPVSRRLNVVGIEIPDQGVRDYGLVIWGTAGPSVRIVHAGYDATGGETRAAVFSVRRPLAQAVGATRPFRVFVVELHPEATCARIGARTPTGWITKVAEYRPRLCPSL